MGREDYIGREEKMKGGVILVKLERAELRHFVTTNRAVARYIGE